MKQKIEFKATMYLDDVHPAQSWTSARKLVRQALLDGDGGEVSYELNLDAVTALALDEEA
jgi:hypothetical protein